ncbi:hypothetical protein HRM2_10230 [Desulforapulum autotrophicum HRM2]|uniref:Uncharacterized protein n=1 Tax=Desulforapulum autotrophicum (strain ATCC 43914 / DSM 3382 / VKM B-1955 / HRM2) TaxID=177437 RepID=C0QL49_DESAH|nr:hypothetical protein HRM2_10230 [Desulforapulum autotrophicum HRM2]
MAFRIIMPQKICNFLTYYKLFFGIQDSPGCKMIENHLSSGQCETKFKERIHK